MAAAHTWAMALVWFDVPMLRTEMPKLDQAWTKLGQASDALFFNKRRYFQYAVQSTQYAVFNITPVRTTRGHAASTRAGHTKFTDGCAWGPKGLRYCAFVQQPENATAPGHPRAFVLHQNLRFSLRHCGLALDSAARGFPVMAKLSNSLWSAAAMGVLVATTLHCASGQAPSIEANGRDITLNVPDGANVAVSPWPFPL